MTHEHKTGRRQHLAGSATVALIAFAIFNGVCLMFGFFESLSDQVFIARLLIPLLAGITIATMIAKGWTMLMTAASSGDRDISTATIGGGLAIFGIIVSAWFLATLIGGDEALKDHQAAALEQLQIQKSRIDKNTALDLKVLAAVKTASVEVDQMARAEATKGTISQKGEGAGEWTQALQASAASLAARANDMQRQNDRREGELTLFNKTLVEARLAVSKGENDRFHDLLIRASKHLADADRIANYETVKALGIGQMAQEAREQIADTYARLNEVASDAETQWRREDIPFYRPVSKHVASFERASAIPGAWAVAVIFEILPLLLLLIVLSRPTDPEESEEISVGQNDNDGEQKIRRVA
jgi:hypothetical protein